MMLFSNHSPKPRSGTDVAGLAAIAKRAPIPGERERASRIGDMLMGLGAGVAVKCANPRAVRPPADDETVALRKAVGAYINPPIGRALRKIPGDPRDPPYTEPQPRPDQADLDFMWSPAVSPDLRANLIHAVKERSGAERIGTPFTMLQWDNSVSDLRDAIAELIERIGPAASALSRILNGGGAGGAMAMTQGKALMRSALSEYSASIRKSGAVRKFHDLSKYGDGGDGDDFDWFSYGRTQLHGAFSGEDIRVAEMWRGSIARAPALVNSPDFHAWGTKMIKRYGLSGPRAEGVVGYVCGAFGPAARRKR